MYTVTHKLLLVRGFSEGAGRLGGWVNTCTRGDMLDSCSDSTALKYIISFINYCICK